MVYLKRKSATIKNSSATRLSGGRGCRYTAPLTAQGEHCIFFFSFFLSFYIQDCVGLTRGLPQLVPAALPREFYVSLLAWPRGPVTGPVLCFFAGLAARPWYYWPWRRPLGWLIAIVTCRQYCVIKYMCYLTKDAFLV